MQISIPCHLFCSGKRLLIPAARPYLSVYIVSPPPPEYEHLIIDMKEIVSHYFTM